MRSPLHLVAMIATAVAVMAPQAIADKPPRALVIVVAKTSPIRNLTRAQLKRLFSADPVVVFDERLVPFNYPPGTPERIQLDRVILGMSPEQVGRFWVDRKIRGETGAPRALPSPAHVAKVVAKFPNAISYMASDQLTPDVVPIAIDGVLPSSPQYLLKPD